LAGTQFFFFPFLRLKSDSVLLFADPTNTASSIRSRRSSFYTSTGLPPAAPPLGAGRRIVWPCTPILSVSCFTGSSCPLAGRFLFPAVLFPLYGALRFPWFCQAWCPPPARFRHPRISLFGNRFFVPHRNQKVSGTLVTCAFFTDVLLHPGKSS